MKKILTILLALCLVLFASGIVFAADEVLTASAPNTSSPTTYGQCVSEKATVKNSCFSVSKETLTQCKANVAGDKKALKQCSKDYKTAKKQCKSTFKTDKVGCQALKNKSAEETD